MNMMIRGAKEANEESDRMEKIKPNRVDWKRSYYTLAEQSARLTAENARLRSALTAIQLQCAADAQGGEWTTAISRVQALVKTGLKG